MIKLLRVDHRLLHGQVAFAWTGYLDADCILIANDDVVVNDLRKSTIRLAKPSGVKLVMKSIDDAIKAIQSGVTDKYNLFIVVETIEDGYRLAKAIDEIEVMNLGGVKKRPDTQLISKSVSVTEQEIQMLDELVSMGKKVEFRLVPNDAMKYYN